jgi:hypothetical protein
MGSLFKKIKSIGKYGLEPLEEGMANYQLDNSEIEKKASERALECLSCHNFEEEPIDLFKIIDDRIPEISEMMCGDCGCALPYLLRQDIKICKIWRKKDID